MVLVCFIRSCLPQNHPWVRFWHPRSTQLEKNPSHPSWHPCPQVDILFPTTKIGCKIYSISHWKFHPKNRQVAKPYVVSHHAQWLGCCSTIQLSCIAVRDLESTLRILVGKLTFNQEVITFSTNQRYHTSYVFFLPPKIMRFSTESKLHKTQNHLFFWEMEKSVRPSQEESSFHPPSAQKIIKGSWTLCRLPPPAPKKLYKTQRVPLVKMLAFFQIMQTTPNQLRPLLIMSCGSFGHLLSTSRPWKKTASR